MADISNSKDILDVRDIIALFEELDDERQSLVDVLDAARSEHDGIPAETLEIQTASKELATWMEDNADEFETLRELLNDMQGYGGDEQWRGDWYPVTLIRDSNFKDYAEELAEDCGMIQAGATWPNNCIDWDEAARQLRMDYSSVEFDGVTYWYR